MNYYPYFNGFPYMNAATTAKTGIFSNLLGGIKWSSIINGTQKTLNIVNQTLPLIKQARPVINNAKTMFKVMNEFKRIDNPIVKNNTNVKNTNSNEIEKKTINTPTFFQ